MTTTVENQQAEQQEEVARQRQVAIGKQVMLSLGLPSDLHKLEVRHLWNNNYRVNVFVGQDATTLKVAHSFFLLSDDLGRVLVSHPKIIRHYGPSATIVNQK